MAPTELLVEHPLSLGFAGYVNVRDISTPEGRYSDTNDLEKSFNFRGWYSY